MGTFEVLLDQACEIAHLPEMARLLLPSTLSEGTKDMTLKLTPRPEELGRILKSAIDQIDHGSVESVDVLVRENIRG